MAPSSNDVTTTRTTKDGTVTTTVTGAVHAAGLAC